MQGDFVRCGIFLVRSLYLLTEGKVAEKLLAGGEKER